jgi:hypothetical protein
MKADVVEGRDQSITACYPRPRLCRPGVRLPLPAATRFPYHRVPSALLRQPSRSGLNVRTPSRRCHIRAPLLNLPHLNHLRFRALPGANDRLPVLPGDPSRSQIRYARRRTRLR